MQTIARVAIAIALALAGCGDNASSDDQPTDPSDAAGFRGYAAVQDDLYAKLMASDSQFELFRYLGDAGDELSKLVGRPDGFGVQYDVRNSRPNAMNVLVWRMMMQPLASDLAATCPGTKLQPIAKPAIELNPTAASIAGALCAWPDVSDQALGDAWDLVVGYLAPSSSRDAFLGYAKTADLQARPADDALPNLWLGTLLHPAFLLEQ
jgi:hypothetical protein